MSLSCVTRFRARRDHKLSGVSSLNPVLASSLSANRWNEAKSGQSGREKNQQNVSINQTKNRDSLLSHQAWNVFLVSQQRCATNSSSRLIVHSPWLPLAPEYVIVYPKQISGQLSHDWSCSQTRWIMHFDSSWLSNGTCNATHFAEHRRSRQCLLTTSL